MTTTQPTKPRKWLTRRRLTLLAAAIALALFAASIFCVVFLSQPTPLRRAYNQVRPGMAESDVKQILGEPFVRWTGSFTSSGGKSMLGDGYAWRSENDVVVVAFLEGVATEKFYDPYPSPLIAWLRSVLKRLGL